MTSVITTDEAYSHIKRLITYLHEEEKHFECEYELEVRDYDTFRFSKKHKQHIFYSVVQLRKFLVQP